MYCISVEAAALRHLPQLLRQLVATLVVIKEINDLRHFMRSVAVVGLGIDALRRQRDDVIQASCMSLCFERTYIYSTAVQHEHHLPLVLVAADASVARAAECF